MLLPFIIGRFFRFSNYGRNNGLENDSEDLSGTNTLFGIKNKKLNIKTLYFYGFGSGIETFSLPERYKPSHIIYFPLFVIGDKSVYICKIDTVGTCTIYTEGFYEKADSTKQYYGAISYF